MSIINNLFLGNNTFSIKSRALYNLKFFYEIGFLSG